MAGQTGKEVQNFFEILEYSAVAHMPDYLDDIEWISLAHLQQECTNIFGVYRIGYNKYYIKNGYKNLLKQGDISHD